MPLGFMPGGYSYSEALDVSGDGIIVVGTAANSANVWESYRWSQATGMQGIGDLPGGEFQSYAASVSANGSVIVGTGTEQIVGNLLDAFRWTSESGIQPLGHFPKSGFVFSYGKAISGNGLVAIGDSRSTSGNEAFRWTSASGLVGLGDLPGGPFESYVNDISGDGSVIVGQSKSSSINEAFKWTAAEGMVGLGFMPGFAVSTVANAVSADGNTIVGYSSSRGWRWTAGTGMVSIDDLPNGGSRTIPQDVSANGSIIVGAARDATGDHAFIWDAVHGTRDLQRLLKDSYGLPLDGWKLFTASAVSNDGMIVVGSGTNPSGSTEGWLINLAVPEPLTLIVLAELVMFTSIIRGHRVHSEER